MSTVVAMTEVPDGELRERLAEILGRVEAGEELVITVAGRPVAELHPIPHRRHVLSWDEFWAGQERNKPDRAFAADVRDLVGDETTDDLRWA
jgi:prevent-host-death family protein